MGYGRVRKVPTKRDIQNGHRLFASLLPDPGKRAAYERDFVKPMREIRRPVDKRPVGPSEHQLQAAVITWWRLAHRKYGLPEFSLFAIPNGGARDVITGALLKKEGVRKGVVDLMLAYPKAGAHGLFIEMKTGSNKPSDEQQEFIAFVEAQGYRASVHWATDSAIKAIEEYLA